MSESFTFRFDATVDHQDEKTITQEFAVPPGYQITSVTGPAEHSKNGYTWLEQVSINSAEPNKFTVRYHVQGNGVRKVNLPFVGEQIVDHLGRGWIKADFTAHARN